MTMFGLGVNSPPLIIHEQVYATLIRLNHLYPFNVLFQNLNLNFIIKKTHE